MARSILAAALFAAFSNACFAQAAQELEAQGQRAYEAKQYAQSAALYQQAWRREPNAALQYNAACSHALAGDVEQAFRALLLAVEGGYRNVEHMERDGDLAVLRRDARWAPLVAEAKEKQAFDARLFDSPALASPYRENLGEDEKVAGLSKFWSEVKYNFVYVDKLREIDWDRLYLETIPKVRATTSTAEYYRVLMELCAKLQDGHTNVYPGEELRRTTMARPLLQTQLVEGKVLVRAVQDPALLAKGIAPGAEILEVDGEPVIAYVERELVPVISASTPQDMVRRAYGYSFLSGRLDKAPTVLFRLANGKTVALEVRRVDPETYAKTLPQTPPFELRKLPGNVAHVALNSFGDRRAADAWLAAFEQIKASSAVIIDVRNNGGGNSDVGYKVLATLTDKPFETGRWSTRQYVPTYRAWNRAMPDLNKPHKPWAPDGARHYTGPVALLTSSGTYSAAEDFTVAFASMKRGPIVGEATGGSTGQPLFISLPGGGVARICTKADTFPDGRAWVGHGIQPDIKAAPRVKDLRGGGDTVLAAALAALKPHMEE